MSERSASDRPSRTGTSAERATDGPNRPTESSTSAAAGSASDTLQGDASARGEDAGTTDDRGESATDGTDGDEAAPSSGAGSLSVEQVAEVLRNERRRRVLDYLDDHEGPVQLGTLAREIAAVEHDIDPALVSSDERKSVYVGLYQCHLPRMDGMGVVEFDQRRGAVERGPNAARVREHMDVADSSSRVPLACGTLAVVGLVAVTSLAGRSERLALAASLLTAVGVAALSTVHRVAERDA